MKFKELWQNLSAKRKQGLVFAALVALGLVVGSGVYYMKFGGSSRQVSQEKTTKKEIQIDPHLLEKSAYQEGQKKFENYSKELANEIAAMKQQMAEMKADPNSVGQAGQPPQVPGAKTSQPAAAGQASAGPPPKTTVVPMPPPPMPGAFGQAAMPPGPPAIGTTADDASQGVIGAIEVYSFKQSDAKDRTAEKKSKDTLVYLPTSFMPATILSGLAAETMDGGKNEPAPVLLRINNLAFLPNRVKANLKGCFVIAEGHGKLSDERVHLRVVNLACLSKKGSAVIDQKIKGFVVDSDGKIGLRGEVVSKFGAMIGRSLIAGLFGGLGDSIQAQTQTQSISALGTTNTIDTDKVWQAGIGGGLSTASHEIQKFYMELARQTLPVIEVGAVRDVTIVVSEGVELKIRDIGNTVN